MLMLILVYVRAIAKQTSIDLIKIKDLMTPFYPASQLVDSVNHTWVLNITTVAETGSSLNDFMYFTNYSGFNYTSKKYDPVIDFKGPFSFMPEHCYQPKQFNSPLIAVIPQNNSIEDDLINQLNSLFQNQKNLASQMKQPMFGNFTIKNFSSQEELFTYIGDEDYGVAVKPAICFGFKIVENNLKSYELELFFNDLLPRQFLSIPNQKKKSAIPSNKLPDLNTYKLYMQNGFSFLQNWVANAILKKQTMNKNAQIVNMVTPMLQPSIVIDEFEEVLQVTLPLFLMLMFVPLLYRTVYRIVFEKVTRAKESMRMMGMSDFSYWFSWFIYYTTVNTILSTASWGILMINCIPIKAGGFIWLFIWLYGQSIFGLLVIIQSLFSSPRPAAISTTVIYFGTYALSAVVNKEDTPRNTKILLGLFFPTVTMQMVSQSLVVNLMSGVGLSNKTLNLQYQNISVSDSIWLFIAGGLIMFLIGVYLEFVLPKTYGKRLHPLFFIFCCCKSKLTSKVKNSDGSKDRELSHETKNLNPEYYEGVPREVQIKEQTGNLLKITDLKKTYSNGLQAVNGINLKMYSDQIFVLLGHNGAGKTSMIFMLTGLFEKSFGSAELFGIDMFTDMSSVRQIMGVCPQHDVLFELLTIEEHLSFFYDLKGADPAKKKAEIDKLMKDVGVYEKRNALAYQLSGGNKRKLSVAIALCGNSKFVVLDEPSSGMDLTAKRQMWNMLKEQKKDRIILLTTHYMDEADILGDRIGIMSMGKVKALGSSIFLKTKFGVGYNLTVVKTNSEPNPEIISYLKENLGADIKCQSEIQSEMTLQIPFKYARKFAPFFQIFDEQLKFLKILSYGISISTLEEVFLKVGYLDVPLSQDTPQIKLTAETDKKKVIARFNLKDNVDEIDGSFFNNFKAVLYKRFQNYKRNKKAILNESILPALLMILGIGLTRIQTSWQSPSKILSPSQYPLPQKLLFNTNTIVNSNIQIQELAAGLPDAQSSFQISFWNNTQIQNTTFSQYYEKVYDYGLSQAYEPPYMYGSYQIFEANTTSHDYKFITFVNLTSQDAAVHFPQFMYESILKTASQDQNFQFKLKVTSYPPTQLINEGIVITSAITVVFFSSISLSMMVTAVVSYLVVERKNGLRHLQVISGMQLKAYWLGNFIFDFAKMQVTILITIILFYGFDLKYNTAWITYLIIPFAILPFTYVSSFVFTADGAAQTFTFFFHTLILGIGSTLIFVLRLAPSTQKHGDQHNLLLKLVPSYLIGSSVFCDSSCKLLSDARDLHGATGNKLSPDVWDWSNNSFDAIALILHCFFWSIQLLLIEKGFWRCCHFNPNINLKEYFEQDDDVVNEQIRVHQSSLSDIIQLQNFKKVYSTKSGKFCSKNRIVAVRNLSFALTNGECFALLGVNGSGKSTIFKSLTCEVKPTQGTIKIAGYDIQKNLEKARKLIGYCPQANLIFEDMRVEEHLIYYAAIKGIPSRFRTTLIEQAIEQLGLQIHRKKLASTLSGGNKRKLCLAIALIGNPPIILLDEPSAGMDPESRRFMWSLIGEIAQTKTSAVVLTTHSMEEAEALSTKMGIMVKGGIFKCFGSAQHIKNKFGTGFVVEIKIKTLEDCELNRVAEMYFPQGELCLDQLHFDQKIKEMIFRSIDGLVMSEKYRQIHSDVNLYLSMLRMCEIFGQIELVERYGNYMRVRMARLDKSIGFVFGLVEEMRSRLDVSEYSVSQTTLEQIFLHFADVSYKQNAQKFTVQVTKSDQKELTII